MGRGRKKKGSETVPSLDDSDERESRDRASQDEDVEEVSIADISPRRYLDEMHKARLRDLDRLERRNDRLMDRLERITGGIKDIVIETAGAIMEHRDAQRLDERYTAMLRKVKSGKRRS